MTLVSPWTATASLNWASSQSSHFVFSAVYKNGQRPSTYLRQTSTQIRNGFPGRFARIPREDGVSRRLGERLEGLRAKSKGLLQRSIGTMATLLLRTRL